MYHSNKEPTIIGDIMRYMGTCQDNILWKLKLHNILKNR